MILLAAITPQPVLGKERHINKSVKRGELLSRPLCSYPAATPIDLGVAAQLTNDTLPLLPAFTFTAHLETSFTS